MDASVTWKGKMAFEAEAGTSFRLDLDADTTVGGQGNGFRPMQLIAMGLVGCTAMDVISILGKKRQAVTDFQVQVHAGRAPEHPKVFTEAVIEYLVTGKGIDEAAVVRAIELSATRYCPAQAMLSKAFPMQLEYVIYEDLGEGKRELVKKGAYVPQVGGQG